MSISLQSCFPGTMAVIHSIPQPKPHPIGYRYNGGLHSRTLVFSFVPHWNCQLGTVHCACPHAFRQITSDGQHTNLRSLHIHSMGLNSGQKPEKTVTPHKPNPTATYTHVSTSLAKMSGPLLGSGHSTVNTMEDRRGRQRVGETNTVKNLFLCSLKWWSDVCP